jgi:hypothetical protein
MGKKKLEEWLNISIEHFAYPYGAYNRDIMKTIKKLKFYSAVTTHPAIIRSKLKKLYEIPRFEIKNYNDFESVMSEL